MVDDQKEIFIVVDKDDNVIDHRTRYDCHHDKSLIHRAVGVIITNDKGEILLQKRGKYKDTSPGLYDVAATGHVGKGESYEEAAKREMQEEIGVSAELEFIDKMLVEFSYETEFDAFFQAKHNGPFAINHDEIDEVTFATKQELRDGKYELTSFARKALKMIEVL